MGGPNMPRRGIKTIFKTTVIKVPTKEIIPPK